MYEKTDEFCALYGEDRLTAICEAAYNNGSKEGTFGAITFLDVIRHDAINVTLYGYFQHGDDEVCFEIDDGNWAGTVVRSFGEDTKSPPTGRTVRIMDMQAQDQWVALPARTALLDLYRSWIIGEVGDFKEVEKAYAYDAHFAPGGKTTEHYQKKAQQRGVVLSSGWVDGEPRIFGRELKILKNRCINQGPQRDTPEAASRQAAYMDGLALWLADQGRETAAGNARRAADEWRTWVDKFAAGETTDSILAGEAAIKKQIESAFS